MKSIGDEAVECLRVKLIEGIDTDMAIRHELDDALWEAVIAYQGHRFFTVSGLPFSYIIKRGKSGEYTGELLVSRKEESKTLTKSSLMYAFHKVLEHVEVVRNNQSVSLIPAEYKGPKAIGQIFGISYIYSLFFEFGLIRIPSRIEDKIKVYKE